MNRTVGLAIGAAVLAIVIGVMVGLVIHAGQVERAGISPIDSRPAPATDASGGSTSPPLWSTLTSVQSSRASQPTSVPSFSAGQIDQQSSPTSAADPTTGVSGSAAGRPCPTLADRSSDSAGTTLFCQVDQIDRTLRWRAVVDEGGCLSQKMVGVGADGVQYRCTLDANGQNHWAPDN